MTPDLWLEAHSYLRPLADVSAQVDRAAAGIDVKGARVPDWEDYRADFLAGVPLLRSSAAAVDLEPGGRMAGALLERLASATSSGKLAVETRAPPRSYGASPGPAARGLPAGDETLTPPVPRLPVTRVDGDGGRPPSRQRLDGWRVGGAVASAGIA
jgi:hypothetical protein